MVEDTKEEPTITIGLSDEQHILYADIFSQAVGHLLQDDEGIFIRSRVGSAYLVSRNNGSICLSEISEEGEKDAGFSHGRMVFIHDTDKEPSQKDMERMTYRKAKVYWDQLTDQQKMDMINDEP